MKKSLRGLLAVVLFLSMSVTNVGPVVADDTGDQTVVTEPDAEPQQGEQVLSDSTGETKELTFEDDQVAIHITEETENAIPENASLKVMPIVKGSTETGEVYTEVESRLQEKGNEESYDIEGFLAYDITLTDENGSEIEPDGDVNVTMNYKQAALPEEAGEAAEAPDETEVKVIHLEEDQDGQVQVLVDMSQSGQLKALDKTENNEVTKAEFVTGSFSVYTIAWLAYGEYISAEDAIIPTAQGILSSEELGVPEHNKTIKRNGTDANGIDSYTIALDVIGKQLPAEPIDVLLILDFSGSMKYRLGSENDASTVGDSRIAKVRNAITILKNRLQAASEKTTVRFAMVEFSGPSHGADRETDYQTSRGNGAGDASILQSWTEYQAFTVPTAQSMYNQCGGGTNWQAGIRQGNVVMQSADPSARRFVIFLTDGLPTFRYGTAQGSGGSISNINIRAGQNGRTYGTGNSDNNGHNFALAKAEHTASAALIGTTARFVVRASTADNNCSAFAAHIGATGADGGIGVLDGSNDASLNSSFQTIAQDIEPPAYRNVVIQDKLGPYVQFAGTTPAIRVYSKNASGTETQLNSNQYTVDQALLAQGIVSVSLLNGGALENNVTYRIEFEVIPSDQAVTGPYRGEGYNGTGDSGTDHSSNSPVLSSGQSGYWSNDNENTLLYYNVNLETKTPEPYQKPVFQVQTTKHSVKKLWVGATAEELNRLAVKIQLKATAVKDTGVIDLGSTGYFNLPEVTLNAANSWAYIWKNLPKYYYYYGTDGTAKHAAIQYSADETTVPGGYDKTIANAVISDPDDTQAVINQTQITNTSWLNKLSVKKVNAANPTTPLPGAEFKLEVKDGSGAWEIVKDENGQDYITTTGPNGMAVFDKLPKGDYRITETKAPEDYSLQKDPVYITLPYHPTDPPDEDISCNQARSITSENKTTCFDITVTIKNSKLYNLPQAGGIGTHLFTTVGFALMTFASTMFIKNKRKRGKKGVRPF